WWPEYGRARLTGGGPQRPHLRQFCPTQRIEEGGLTRAGRTRQGDDECSGGVSPSGGDPVSEGTGGGNLVRALSGGSERGHGRGQAAQFLGQISAHRHSLRPRARR